MSGIESDPNFWIIVGGSIAAAAGGATYAIKRRKRLKMLYHDIHYQYKLTLGVDGPPYYVSRYKAISTIIRDPPLRLLQYLRKKTLKGFKPDRHAKEIQEDSRKVNVWIKDHDSEQPLLDGQVYQLMINVGKIKEASLVSVGAESLESVSRKLGEIKLDVVVVANRSDISPSTQALTLPVTGDSESLSFSLRPKGEGSESITILFYYKANLLLVISVPLEIHTKPTVISKSEKRSELLDTELILLSDRGFESILEIDKET